MRRIITTCVIIFSLITIVFASFEVVYWKKIFPKVRVNQVDLGGLTLSRAEQKMAGSLVPQSLLLHWGTAEWSIAPQTIGLEYDLHQTVQLAYQTGRQNIFNWPKKVDPIFSWQENKFQQAIASISAQINIPAREPEVQLNQGRVTIQVGENGQVVDEKLLRQRISLAIANLSANPIEIPVTQLQPKLSPDQAEIIRLRATKLLNKKLTLILEDKPLPAGRQDWDIDSDQIFVWLDASGWNRPAVEIWVSQLATGMDRPAQNALFKYVGAAKVEEFKPAKSGFVVKKDDLVNQIISHLDQLEIADSVDPLPVPVVTILPIITTNGVNSLGIKELIGHGESNFTGSISNRIFNLKKAAQNMNGILISPGETFSFNKYVGDISAEGGYKQAYVIKEGKTILGDGGGVCQVSTTLFRAALNTGLPIVERTAHAYRVHYYENDSQPGLDATIFTPTVDFKFQNDTPAYILIQTSVDETNKKLTFDLYGTGDGRQVSLSKPKVWDVTPPPPDLYTDDPTLPRGTVKQVDFKAWGAKVSFDYKVTRGSDVLQSRTFYSNFRPWQAVFLRGPQT